jgi:glycosyltransferase involved in cell wall biosynthesis
MNVADIANAAEIAHASSMDESRASALSEFDAVVMLTWSNWHSEPRSNRFHYATRFARHKPVYFVQPDAAHGNVSFEPVEGFDITLVHVPGVYDMASARALGQALSGRGVRKPLLWIYNVFFEHFIHRSGAPLKVYHATEDYLSKPDGWVVADESVRRPLLDILRQIDLLVAVSPGVAESYRRAGGYSGRAVILPNGCDFEFWKASRAARAQQAATADKIALFQGGVNARLDYDLLAELARLRPDWRFWFCGSARDGGAGWAELSEHENVRHFGELDPPGIARLAAQARVGLIPFKQDKLIRNSLPLKAWEYVACGLPVVTVPIDALEAYPDFFRAETTASGFAAALDAVAPSRSDPGAIEMRLAAAGRQSYDHRFAELCDALGAALKTRENARPRLNLLLIYDDNSTHVRTITEHIEAFQKYSRHNIVLMVGTHATDFEGHEADLDHFDAILVHYSVRVSLPDHLSEPVAEAIAAYDGPKMLFAQDEYESTETTRRWIERLGIDTVFTNVPLAEIEKVYPRRRFPYLRFVPTLTGYVPEDPAIEDFCTPLAERRVLIGYRGRRLPHHYGELGHDKWLIGKEMRRLADERGLPVDIEVEDGKRIYGSDWYRFLGSCRATLGTESGANVFDFDGSLKARAAEKDVSYAEFAAAHLMGREGEVRMNQVSPKIFEAIRLRTALILFEGEYSGVVEAERHYIPLARDFSNVDDVFRKLADLDYLEALTERAFREVIQSECHSYRRFVQGVDAHIDSYALARPRARLLSAPAFAVYGRHRIVPLSAWTSSGAAVGSVVLDGELREVLREAVRRSREMRVAPFTRWRRALRHRLTGLVEACKRRVRSVPWLIGLIRRLRGIEVK